jgi:hypothetical protein
VISIFSLLSNEHATMATTWRSCCQGEADVPFIFRTRGRGPGQIPRPAKIADGAVAWPARLPDRWPPLDSDGRRPRQAGPTRQWNAMRGAAPHQVEVGPPRRESGAGRGDSAHLARSRILFFIFSFSFLFPPSLNMV